MDEQIVGWVILGIVFVGVVLVFIELAKAGRDYGKI